MLNHNSQVTWTFDSHDDTWVIRSLRRDGAQCVTDSRSIPAYIIIIATRIDKTLSTERQRWRRLIDARPGGAPSDAAEYIA